MRTISRLLLPILLTLPGLLSSCSDLHASSEGHRFSQEPTVANDARLDESQVQLLKLSYRAATKFPLNPHIKNRSRAQAEVAEACFALDAPERALVYINGISNWRKGAGYADYAAYIARHGDSARLRTYLDKAIFEAETAEDWRKHRIQAKVAQVLMSLGKTEQASALSQGLAPTEALAVEASRAVEAREEELASQLAWVDGAFKAGDLDQVKWALSVCVQYYGDHYDNEEVRESILERVLDSMHKAPRQIALGTLLDLAEVAIARGATDTAGELIERVRKIVGETEWLPEDKIPLVARIATVAYAAGDEAFATQTLGDLNTLYQESRGKIVDVFRCSALVPLAEAYWNCGDAKSAQLLYALAVDEALVNPNARPRADDLIRIGCSMAVLGVTPETEWLEAYRRAVGLLDEPW